MPLLDLEARGPGFNLVRSLKVAREAHGRSVTSQIGEMVRLARGPGRVNPIEYYQFRLYDDRAFDHEAKRRFLGNAVRARYQRECVAHDWLAMTTDKAILYALLRGLSLPHPALRALVHPARTLGSVRALRTLAEAESFLRDPANHPLFGKPADGVGSTGIVAFTGVVGDELRFADGRRAAVSAFVAELAPFLDRGYLFQERLSPHPGLAASLGGRLSGVRLLVLHEGGEPEVLRATWKIPAGANQADNFWRPGNLVAAIDPETGRVIRIVRGVGIDQEVVDDHPDTGARLFGATLPDWDKVRALVLEAAAAFPGLWLQGWDVALSDRGPVILELEGDGGAQTLTQYATGRGLLDDRFRAFLEAWRSDARRRRRRGRRKRWVLKPTPPPRPVGG
jgi:hypothetical protein